MDKNCNQSQSHRELFKHAFYWDFQFCPISSDVSWDVSVSPIVERVVEQPTLVKKKNDLGSSEMIKSVIQQNLSKRQNILLSQLWKMMMT